MVAPASSALPEDAVLGRGPRLARQKGEAEAHRQQHRCVQAGPRAGRPAWPCPAWPPPRARASAAGITGNEAPVSARRGGVRFVAAYPITPGTGCSEWLAPNLAKLGGVLVQAEDELASMNMIIGASYGRRALADRHRRPRPGADDRRLGPAVAAGDPDHRGQT